MFMQTEQIFNITQKMRQVVTSLDRNMMLTALEHSTAVKHGGGIIMLFGCFFASVTNVLHKVMK